MAHSKFFHGPLYQRTSDELHLTGLSQRTHDGYLRAIRQLADHCRLSPEQISEEQVRQYFLHLKLDRHFASGSLRVALSGIKFFYSQVCPRDWQTLKTLRVKDDKQLPVVLTAEQVHQIIDACTTLRMATYFWTVYSLGLRLQEGLNLQVGDIDSQRGWVHIHRGKGAKDRYVPLPTSTLLGLRQYYRTHRHPRLLFPAEGREHRVSHESMAPMSLTSAQGAIKSISRQLNFGKKVSTHTLRHCYATHLLEAGVSLRVIQQYLGHTSLQTTTVYLQLTDTAEETARQAIERVFQREVKATP